MNFHLPLEGGGRPASAGRVGGDGGSASAARPHHPTPDRLRRSAPPPTGEGGELAAHRLTLRSSSATVLISAKIGSPTLSLSSSTAMRVASATRWAPPLSVTVT